MLFRGTPPPTIDAIPDADRVSEVEDRSVMLCPPAVTGPTTNCPSRAVLVVLIVRSKETAPGETTDGREIEICLLAATRPLKIEVGLTGTNTRTC